MLLRITNFILCSCLLFGEEIVIDSPKIITPQWEEQVFGVKQGAQDLVGSLHEMIDGLIDEQFGEDFFAKIEEAVKKQPTGEGIYTEYWKNGIKRAQIPFKNGKAHGHVHGWHDSGEEAFKGFFSEGVKQGIHITFFYTKREESTKEAHVYRYNEKGELHGKQRKIYQMGRLWIASTYNNGKLNGPLETWTTKGEQLLCADYKEGVLQKNPPPPPGKRVIPGRSIDQEYMLEICSNFDMWALKKYNLKRYSIGGSMIRDIESHITRYIFEGKVTIDEAREMFIDCNETLTQMINEHEKIRPYLRDYPFPRTRVNITIKFCDKHGFDNSDGSVSRASFGIDDQIFYRSQKSLDSQNEVFLKEPYAEALKIVRSKK
jgi:hypothetical protein